MTETEGHGGGDHHDAIAGPDDKVDPGEVPVCTYTGGGNMPQTDGKDLLVFNTEEGGTVAVRLDPEETDEMIEQIGALKAL